jgi:Zn-dependent M28 family amino/carboxypeptidase
MLGPFDYAARLMTGAMLWAVVWAFQAAPGPLERTVEAAVGEETALLRADVRLGALEAAVGAAPGSIDRALSLIEAGGLRAQLQYYAGDALAGRSAGSENERRATEFIARHFAAAGLRPVGEAGGYFQPFPFGSGRVSRNCLGLREGSDPKLKEQIVVIGAHHDHVGSNADGHPGRIGKSTEKDDIWNGADDNGSGTTAVLAIARAFGAAGLKPRRSILFMTFGAEEWGLHGSQYYVSRPVAPIDRHVAMINLDMIGRNPDKAVQVYGVGTATAFADLVDGMARRTGLRIEPHDGVTIKEGGDSDHTPFHRAKVPSIFFFAGFHRDYHRISDSVEKVDTAHQARVAQTAALVLWDLANRDEAP